MNTAEKLETWWDAQASRSFFDRIECSDEFDGLIEEVRELEKFKDEALELRKTVAELEGKLAEQAAEIARLENLDSWARMD